MPQTREKVRVPDLLGMKRRGRKIAMLTAYDASFASLLDDAGIDVLLVGDSLGMVVMGLESTVAVTLDSIVHHCQSVANGARRALIVADLPFLTYATTPDALRNAGRLIQSGRASAVKMEGGAALGDTIRAMTSSGIPVMGHLGLLPQHEHTAGGFRAAGKTRAEADRLTADAHALEDAGAFALVLESIPAELARRITGELSIPTIGIGAGPHCDGQVLVSYDAFGVYPGYVPRFVKRFADVGTAVRAAARTYIEEVQAGTFPAAEHSISTIPE